MNEILLASGLVVPPIGYGTFPLKERLVESAPMALRCGYKRFNAKMKLKFAWRAFKLTVKDALVALHVICPQDVSCKQGDVCARS